MYPKEWHALEVQDVLSELETSTLGLTEDEAKRRIDAYGKNTLPERKPDSYLKIFVEQFKSPLIYILFLAGAFITLVNEYTDGIIIFAVLLFNAVVGAIQEGKAQNTLFALKKYIETKVTILRNSKEIIVNDFELAIGDIVVLSEGDKIPADLRVIESNGLKIEEAALTGESVAVDKFVEIPHGKNLSTSEQKNMLFKGTHVVAGNGLAVVVAIGVDTVIGKIAQNIIKAEDSSPLKENIAVLSKAIIIAVAAISAVLMIIGIIQGKPLIELSGIVVSLAVSVIPEGLPVVLTLVLATGIWKMSKKNVLVKKMQAVEALGQARIIAVDKTGTITKNEMVAKKIYFAGQTYDIVGSGYEPKGAITLKKKNLLTPEVLETLAKVAALVPTARVAFNEQDKAWQAFGDPTEAAIIAMAGKFGFYKDAMQLSYPKIQEIPFNYKTKYRASLHLKGKMYFAGVIGAPEAILQKCRLSVAEKEELESVYAKFSKQGLRVLGFAYIEKRAEFDLTDDILKNLKFAGFVGIKDVLREEVFAALDAAKNAGIKVVMITGDHKLTAEAIAREAGIFKDGDSVLTGAEIDGNTAANIAKVISNVSVFARVTPEHKFKIIQAYKLLGQTIAMTGDGVNDAPSLVEADLGVAMGRVGTEVAKEASDLVLLDDNFGNIVAAVEEGRNIYRTIKKVILYLFSTSLGEVLTIAGALIIGWPLPILASQIIWLNFVTDGFLTVALAMEPKDKDLLEKRFLKPNKYLMDPGMAKRMIVMALPMAVGSLFLFGVYHFAGSGFVKASTVALTTLAVFQWFNAWNCRSEEKSVFSSNIASNGFLIGALVIVILAQVFAIYNPLMQKLLHTTSLNFLDWLIIILVSTSVLWVEEIRKALHGLRPGSVFSYK